MPAAPMRHVLGLSAYYHDAAAALVREGVVIAAAQEERFSRRKNDERFPQHAVQFCLRHAALEPAQLDAVAFYDKPITKFARLLESYLAVAPAGLSTFPRVLPGWLGEKLNLRKTLRDELPGLPEDCPILFTEHHQAHAASAYLPSPFDAAAILTVDGVGEWATTQISRGSGDTIEALQELRFPHSLGLLYSAFTAYCGFRINSGEYKLMGLAPYGEPRYVRAIYEHLIDVKEDGSFWLNLDYFAFLRSFAMANERFHRLFDGPPRPPESPLEQRHLDAACSIQLVTEEILLKLARHARQLTGQANLCLAGGVALNCVANGRILREGLFDRIWIQPAAGDAGGALGAALAVSVGPFGRPHRNSPARSLDAMQGSALGPEYSDPEIEATLLAHGAVYERIGGGQLLSRTVELLAREKIVGWVQGRMEFGPRALGQRSILGDPRSPRMQSVMNLKVKFRESFRPFAPVVRRERVQDYFELETDSPYMLLVAPVRSALRVERAAGPATARAPGTDAQPTTPSPASPRALAPNLIERVNEPRSSIPAVTHVDYSARIQTVDRTQSPLLYALLEEWERASGCGVLVNTSFNVRGEPIVCTPDDAYRCFVNTEMDYLVMGNFILERAAQPQREVRRTFEPVPD
ncbi:MAG TPA: carbamoyltransferase [Candidatus Saccharimonadales bacterium]|nr:carbamoyltransferase [Candidatus Saccharimonadales bacterium]